MDNQINNEHLKILIFDNGTASHVWRFDGMAARMNRDTPHEVFVAGANQWKGDTLGANLVIFEMSANPEVVRQAHDQGAKVLYEADDAVIDAYGKERKNLMHIGEDWKNKTIECVNACDGIIVTNKILAENFARFTDKPIFIYPNYLDFEWYGDEDWNIQRNSNEIRIGWFGSRGHFEDLRMVLPAIQQVLAKYPNVKFIYQGYGGMSSDKKVTEIGWGEDVFKEIDRSRREFHISVEPEYWAEKHRALDLDIGICPLIDDYFNHCKTNIKWMEFAALKTPSVCSPTVYAEHPVFDGKSTVDHGKTGFIAHTTEDWVKYLSMLVEDKELRRNMGRAAYREVKKNWDLDKHWDEWQDICNKVVFG